MEISLVNTLNSLQSNMNNINTQDDLCEELSKLLYNPNINLFCLLFKSQQLKSGQLKFLIFFIKNKILKFKKQFGSSFLEQLFNEISFFLFEEIKPESLPFLALNPLVFHLNAVNDLRHLLEKIVSDLENMMLLQITERAFEIIQTSFLGKFKVYFCFFEIIVR